MTAQFKHIATARHPGEIWELNGVKLGGVHFREDCTGACVLHNPSDHHMRDWYLLWRSDRAIFERICEHSVGHPDPDQFDYWISVGQESQAVHGCDGCCWDPKATEALVPREGIFAPPAEGEKAYTVDEVEDLLFPDPAVEMEFP